MRILGRVLVVMLAVVLSARLLFCMLLLSLVLVLRGDVTYIELPPRHNGG